MTAPSKVPATPHAAIAAARAGKIRRFPVSDGAPVEVVEDGPSIAGRLMGLAAMATVKPFLTVGSYAPKLPWPWGLLDFAARKGSRRRGPARVLNSSVYVLLMLCGSGGDRLRTSLFS